MARAMKDSGIEWIGQIPENWDTGRAKNCFLNHKKIAGTAAESYERLALTLNGVIKRSKEDSAGLQPEAFNGYQVLKENELVFKLIDLENVSTSRVGLSPYDGIVSPAYIVLSGKKGTNMKYGEYYFLSMWQREVFNHMGDDGVRSSLNAGDLLNVPYIIPMADEQQKIANFLDIKCAAIDAVIEKTKASIEEYKKLRQAIITQAVTKGIRPNRKMKDSGIEWIGEIPEEWSLTRVKWILEERKEKSTTGEEEPLSMSQKYGIIPTKEMDAIPNMASSFVGAKIVYCGDLVFNKLKAHLGVFSVSNYYGLVSPDYAVYFAKNNVNLSFVEYLFKTPQYINEFKKKSTGVGAGLTRLYTDELFSIPIGMPDFVEQKEISEYLLKKITEMNSLISKKEEYLTELDFLKKSLIYEYVTGKKEVPV